MTQRDPISPPAFYDLVNAIEDQSAWDAVAEQMLNMPFGDIRRVAAEMDNKRANVPKEYSAIMGSVYENISFMSDPLVHTALSGSDVSMGAVCEEDCNIFIINPAEFQSVLAPMMRMIFSAAIIQKCRRPSAPRVLLVVDEAAQLGNFEALLRAYTFGRGMGVQAWSFWQDPGQIDRNYGPAARSSFIGSSGVRQFVGVRDLVTAKLMSDMAGQETLEYDAVLEQDTARRNKARVIEELMKGGDPFAAGMSYAQLSRAETHRTKQARQLLMPDEGMTMRDDEQIIFVSNDGLRPIRAQKKPYFTCHAMAGGYMPNPYHPPLDRVRLPDGSWARIVTERVPRRFADWPQYQSGYWSYVQGYRPF